MSLRVVSADSLRAISPASLSAYARLRGWEKAEPYGAHSDVYVATDLPEVILPRTQRLADYADVAARLIQIFAQAVDVDESELLRELTIADRDAIRVRASGDHTVTVTDGLALIAGAKDMISAAARSLFEPRAAYQGRPAKEVVEYLKRVRLGDVEQGSFVVTLLPPAVPPTVDGLQLPPGRERISGTHHNSDEWLENEPIERRTTWQLADALGATRDAMAETIGGGGDAFGNAISRGTSANLCKALADMTAPFEALDLSLTWALTRPTPTADTLVRFEFTHEDSCVLREAARVLRERSVQTNVRLIATVEGLKRQGREVALRTQLDGGARAVVAHLTRRDYERAIDLHKTNAEVEMEGDLECSGHRRSLLNAHIV